MRSGQGARSASTRHVWETVPKGGANPDASTVQYVSRCKVVLVGATKERQIGIDLEEFAS